MAKTNITLDTSSLLLGLNAGALTLTILIYAAVFVPGFKDGLAATFIHHWLGKIVLSYLVFFGVWLGTRFTLKNKEFGNIKMWTWVTTVLLVVSTVLITALMVYHYYFP